MEKDKIFFSESGLTTTSANHIANIAKESYKALEKQLQYVRFYTTEIALLGGTDSKTLRKGVSRAYLDNVDKTLHTIAMYKSLIAWLREAIKAKDRVIREASNITTDMAIQAMGIVCPEKPETYDRLTSDDIIATWNIKQRNRYFQLDTLCSVIGSYIHPEGEFSEERNKLSEILYEDHEVKGQGRDLVLYTMTPTVALEDVDNTFFALQDKYREYQAELNSMKHQIELAINKDNTEKSLKEQEEALNYSNSMKAIYAQVQVYKNQKVTEAQSLKIAIPDSLRGIFEEVSRQGKERK